MMHVLRGHARAGVALIVDIEGYNGVKPRGGQIQGISRLQHDFVQPGLGKAIQRGGVGGHIGPGPAPIHSGMSSRRVVHGIQL